MDGRFERFTMSIFRIDRCWHDIAAAEVKPYGLGPSAALYLAALLRERDGMTAAELSRMCGRDKADVSRTIGAMAGRGLVIKPEGRNYKARIQLTELGREVASVIARRAQAAVNEAGGSLSEEDRATFYRVLDTITVNLDRMREEGIRD